MGILEEEKEKGSESILKQIINEKFPILKSELNHQIQKANRTPDDHNPKRLSPRHIILKLSKIHDEKRNLKAIGGGGDSNL